MNTNTVMNSNTRMNQQMDQVLRAIRRLEELELTVTSVVLIDKTKPLIFIKPSKACQKLVASWTKTSVRCGVREVERVSMVADCQVRWTENTTHNQARRQL